MNALPFVSQVLWLAMSSIAVLAVVMAFDEWRAWRRGESRSEDYLARRLWDQLVAHVNRRRGPPSLSAL